MKYLWGNLNPRRILCSKSGLSISLIKQVTASFQELILILRQMLVFTFLGERWQWGGVLKRVDEGVPIGEQRFTVRTFVIRKVFVLAKEYRAPTVFVTFANDGETDSKASINITIDNDMVHTMCFPSLFASSAASGRGSPAAVGRLLAAATSPVERRLTVRGLQYLLHCGLVLVVPWAELPCDTWNLPGPWMERLSPAWAGGFLTT
ncbi:hypothetical protein MJT46_015371 [Ovis ammon polii x Ovis aries]|nr:hypothetical protein MJT46_015371 [Ovis ammon polii x Ovis aries]